MTRVIHNVSQRRQRKEDWVMVVGNMEINLGEVWTGGSWDEHANRQTRDVTHVHRPTWLTGMPHSSQYSASILGQTNNHSNILSYCMISTVISSNLINNYLFKLQFNHIIFYHLESFYCSLHSGRQLHSRQKIASDKKWGAQKLESLEL